MIRTVYQPTVRNWGTIFKKKKLFCFSIAKIDMLVIQKYNKRAKIMGDDWLNFKMVKFKPLTYYEVFTFWIFDKVNNIYNWRHWTQPILVNDIFSANWSTRHTVAENNQTKINFIFMQEIKLDSFQNLYLKALCII